MKMPALYEIEDLDDFTLDSPKLELPAGLAPHWVLARFLHRSLGDQCELRAVRSKHGTTEALPRRRPLAR